MSPSLGPNAATLCGLGAIVLWSTIVGLIRSVSEHFGAIGGAALIYTVGALLLLPLLGRPRLRGFPRIYLVLGSLLFVAYELCLSLSLGFAHNRTQAIEISIINYLWPCFTIILAIVMNGQQARWPIIPGIALALTGIAWVVSGDQAISLPQTLANVSSNPLSYGLAFAGAVIWGVYCNVTKRYANGRNGVVLFFLLVATTLWLQYAFSDRQALSFSLPASLELLAAAAAMAGGYALWNVGVLRGNLTLMASASYFTPVLSALFAMVWLDTQLTSAFWQGVAMVTGGSLLCWLATREAHGH
ncbi:MULTISPECIES: aromatic amino acid DMT transporter YddG [unclassified Pseudomonas]|uniref:aromatic amino acid DMT transporter YddG n=1 Tax=unclassified Pseudomonas TaxID=196821 RepID=UPI00244D76C2|nr:MULTISPECIES: aromatic amino acid DMT transporter YddG [unclassified Pseudomonas]MDH0894444.1 aromatic amino acid DMT transporter YddG [Pseudomonas sp. GD03875]MDH1063261.1 aromatic amino acid DMT transporter YddG [Pseudomonas sp. GD03985]